MKFLAAPESTKAKPSTDDPSSNSKDLGRVISSVSVLTTADREHVTISKGGNLCTGERAEDKEGVGERLPKDKTPTPSMPKEAWQLYSEVSAARAEAEVGAENIPAFLAAGSEGPCSLALRRQA